VLVLAHRSQDKVGPESISRRLAVDQLLQWVSVDVGTLRATAPRPDPVAAAHARAAACAFATDVLGMCSQSHVPARHAGSTIPFPASSLACRKSTARDARQPRSADAAVGRVHSCRMRPAGAAVCVLPVSVSRAVLAWMD